MRTQVPYAIRWLLTGFGILLGAAGCGGTDEGPIAGRFVSVTGAAPLRHLVLHGTPTSMGRAEGRLLRTEVRAAAARPLPEGLTGALAEYARSMRPLAPAALLEELDAMAKEAGVSASDLFVREVTREGMRWHDMAGAPRSASFTSVPGASPEVVVAFDGADLASKDWIVIERHPEDGIASLTLTRAGEVGAIGGVTREGRVIVVSEVDLAPERRTMRGPPFSWSVRAALDGSGGVEVAIGRMPSLCGHRVLGADPSNLRFRALVTLAAEPPEKFDANVWVLAASGPDGGPLARAQEDKLASYAAPPGAGEDEILAIAGRTRDVVGPVARWTKAGLRFQGVDYAWTPK